MSLLDRVRFCHRFDESRFRPFFIGPDQVGWVRPAFAARLRDFPGAFAVRDDAVALADALDSPAARSEAVDEALRRLAADGVIRGWRDERYAVSTGFSAPPLMLMERAAVPAFGVRSYGVHLNGFVDGAAGLELWVGKRAKDKPTAPGKLDHLVAGGHSAHLTLAETLRKECAEEAAMPADLARRARPVGAVSYRMENEQGLRNDVLFNYDLELPAGFRPRNTDGEIEDFYLWPIDKVCRMLDETDDFKFNVALVIIDFLVRRGVLTPDHPDYLAIVAGLHGQAMR